MIVHYFCKRLPEGSLGLANILGKKIEVGNAILLKTNGSNHPMGSSEVVPTPATFWQTFSCGKSPSFIGKSNSYLKLPKGISTSEVYGALWVHDFDGIHGRYDLGVYIPGWFVCLWLIKPYVGHKPNINHIFMAVSIVYEPTYTLGAIL